MSWYVMVWKRAFEFSGRSRRKEYWMFVLYHLLIQVVLLVASVAISMMGQEMISRVVIIVDLLYILAGVIPYIACFFRRLHDTGRSGWWWLICFVPFVGAIIALVFLATNGEAGENKYGADPKAA